MTNKQTAPRELAEAVARLDDQDNGVAFLRARCDRDSRYFLGEEFAVEGRKVLAALAEAQRERDALQHRFDQFTDPELLRIEALGDTIDKLAAAQAEAAKLRSALKNLCHYIDVMPDSPERLSDEVNFAHMAAQDALAAPPSTAAPTKEN